MSIFWEGMDGLKVRDIEHKLFQTDSVLKQLYESKLLGEEHFAEKENASDTFSKYVSVLDDLIQLYERDRTDCQTAIAVLSLIEPESESLRREEDDMRKYDEDFSG